MAISRQELKKDQFVSTLDSWYEFYLNYQKQVVIGAIVAAVALAIAYGLVAWYRSRNAHAQALLSSGLDAYHAPLAGVGTPPPGITVYPNAKARAGAARKSFQQAVASYSGTEAGREARYYLGLTEIALGDRAAAEKDLRATSAEKDARVASLARHALANLYVSEGKSSHAEAELQQLIAHPSAVVPKSLAMLELAALQAPGNPKSAGQLYRQIQHDFPNTASAQQAAQQLAELPQ